MLKKSLGTAALIAFGFALALVVADVGIRIANHWFPYFYCYDEYRGWALNPGAHGWYTREGHAYVRINRDGFRGPDYPLHKPPGVLRVAVLGDSYVEAMQVAEDRTFTAVIGRELAHCPAVKGQRVEAMNFGVDGYGTAQELITLRKKALAYSPDIVVLAIFLGNDIRNNSVVLEGDQCRPFYVYQGDALTLTGPLIDSPSYRAWCAARFDYRDLRLIGLFKNTWEAIKKGPNAPTSEHPVESAINYNIYEPPTDSAWQDAWRVTEGLVTQVRDETVAHHAMFLAVSEDTGIQVWPDPRVRQGFEAKLRVKDLFYPDRRLAELGRRNGFEVLTLSKALQTYAQAHRVYLHGFSNTPMGFGHWNELGHAEAGRLITAKLCAMLAGTSCESCGSEGRASASTNR
ncbi:MAG TPA: SGNH/GDSL hydrolase family protein [Candidatus Binataceae bacterium]|nr:SGNH/GDSL hydrolase family protein [Candidatus Binataceae bacterium]